MSPDQIRNALNQLQEVISKIESAALEQVATNVGYREVVHELTEAWDSLQRATETVAELTKGLN
jgi:methyl-accepting chemotaxis protein